MSTIESGNGQDIHESQDDRQEGCHTPEHHPVPYRWEQTADGAKATQRFCSVGCCHIFQIVYITAKHTQSVFNTSREALKETIFQCGGLVIVGQRGLCNT